MSSEYPKSRLPGPAVRLFEMEEEQRLSEEARLAADPDATMRGSVPGHTVEMRPEAQRVLVEATRVVEATRPARRRR